MTHTSKIWGYNVAKELKQQQIIFLNIFLIHNNISKHIVNCDLGELAMNIIVNNRMIG